MGRILRDRETRDGDLPLEVAVVEVGDETVEAPAECGLSAAARAGGRTNSPFSIVRSKPLRAGVLAFG